MLSVQLQCAACGWWTLCGEAEITRRLRTLGLFRRATDPPEEMVREVARIYNSLPPDLRKKTAIYTANYGEAGAIDFYGPKYGLPRAISGHQNYFLWGPREFDGQSVILIEDEASPELWQSLKVVGKRYHPYAMPEENAPIFHGIGLKKDLRELWPRTKNWR